MNCSYIKHADLRVVNRIYEPSQIDFETLESLKLFVTAALQSARCKDCGSMNLRFSSPILNYRRILMLSEQRVKKYGFAKVLTAESHRYFQIGSFSAKTAICKQCKRTWSYSFSGKYAHLSPKTLDIDAGAVTTMWLNLSGPERKEFRDNVLVAYVSRGDRDRHEIGKMMFQLWERANTGRFGSTDAQTVLVGLAGISGALPKVSLDSLFNKSEKNPYHAYEYSWDEWIVTDISNDRKSGRKFLYLIFSPLIFPIFWIMAFLGITITYGFQRGLLVFLCMAVLVFSTIWFYVGPIIALLGALYRYPSLMRDDLRMSDWFNGDAY